MSVWEQRGTRLRALLAGAHPGRWELSAEAGDGQLEGLCWLRCEVWAVGGDSAWKGGVGYTKSSSCHQSTKSVFLSPASPFFPIVRWELGTLSPEQLPVSQEHQRLLEPSVSERCSQPGFRALVLRIGGSCHVCEVLMRMEGRAMKWPQNLASKIPLLFPQLLSLPCPHSTAWGQQEQPDSAVPAAN